MNQDASHTCVRELGALGCIQFTDLNPEQVVIIIILLLIIAMTTDGGRVPLFGRALVLVPFLHRGGLEWSLVAAVASSISRVRSSATHVGRSVGLPPPFVALRR